MLNRVLPFVRFLLAWAITLGVLVYCWGRILVFWMLAGRPEWFMVAGLLAAVVAVGLLARRLGLALHQRRWGRHAPWMVGVSWVLLTAGLVGFMGQPFLSWFAFIPLFVLNTLWLPWLAWLTYIPGRWGIKLMGLAILVGLALLFPWLIRIPGLTGAGQPEFAWRGAGKPDLEWEPGAAELNLKDFPKWGTAGAQFRGDAQRLGFTGGSVDYRLYADWKNNPPRLLWRRPVGAGWGSFAVAGNYAVTQEQRGEEECAVCYRLRTGEPCWVHADPIRFDSSLGGPGPRATPTIDRGHVYTVGATGLLNCLDGATGKKRWSVDILEDNHAANISHGVCGSPLVVDDKVIVCPTGAGGPSLVAYQCDTGARLWQGGTDRASYGSPMRTELAGVEQILLMTSVGVASHDPRTGEVLWTYPWTNDVGVNCSQPIPHAGHRDQVLLTTGYGTGSVLLKVAKSERGDWSIQPLWTSRSLKTKFSTAVVDPHFRIAYGLDDGTLVGIDLGTGMEVRRGAAYGHGQILYVTGWLLIQAENGDVAAVKPWNPGFQEVGRLHALEGKTWNHPAVADPFLLVRNAEEAACYELQHPNW